MANKCKEAESPVGVLKSEAARQRWELFHRAIAHAKQTNDESMAPTDAPADEPEPRAPSLTIVR